MNPTVADLTIKRVSTVRSALLLIDRAASGFLIVIDDFNKLKGVVTDGDIRRALLRGVS